MILADELGERAGDQVEVQRVEHRDQGDQDDHPEHADGDPPLDPDLLAGALLDPRVHLEQREEAMHARAGGDRDQPADDEDAERPEDPRKLRPQRGLERASERSQVHLASP